MSDYTANDMRPVLHSPVDLEAFVLKVAESARKQKAPLSALREAASDEIDLQSINGESWFGKWVRKRKAMKPHNAIIGAYKVIETESKKIPGVYQRHVAEAPMAIAQRNERRDRRRSETVSRVQEKATRPAENQQPVENAPRPASEWTPDLSVFRKKAQ